MPVVGGGGGGGGGAGGGATTGGGGAGGIGFTPPPPQADSVKAKITEVPTAIVRSILTGFIKVRPFPILPTSITYDAFASLNKPNLCCDFTIGGVGGKYGAAPYPCR